MFGWRKKRDDFEWHEYVRTTILVRRAKRRQKVDDVRAAAMHGLKDAGHAAAHGLHEAKGAAANGLRNAGRMGQAASASGARLAAKMVKGFWMGASRAIATARRSGSAGRAALVTTGGAALTAVLTPLLARLSDRRTRITVGAVGVAALFAAAYRTWMIGLDARTAFAALLAVSTLGPALIAERQRQDVTHRAPARRKGSARGDEQAASAAAPISMRLLKPVLAWGAGAAVVVFGLGALISPQGAAPPPFTAAITTSSTTPPPTRPASASDLYGRARAVSGDTLRIGRRLVRLDHIEAPEPGQTCRRTNGRTWRCGEGARAALARLVSRARIACTLTGSQFNGSAHGDCKKGDTDIAAALVRDGHVFAGSDFFARHSSLESEARENRRGIWEGEAQRPETFRQAAWDAAKEKAPDACPIKGRVASRAKIYVMPWMVGYDRIKIRSSRGERWFCSEDEALQAGWRPLEAG